MDQTAGLLGIHVLPREGPAVVVNTRTARVLGQLLKQNSQTRVFEPSFNDANKSNNLS